MKSAIFALALLGAAPAMSANLIVNGDFEADPVESTSITGWQVSVGPGDGLNISSGANYAGCCGGYGSPANLANKFVSYGAGESGVDGIVSQAFGTTASIYTVSFDVGAFGGDQTITGSAIDTVTNAVLGTLSVTRPGTSNFDTIFATSSFAFLSVGNAVRLSFTASGSDTGSRDAFLDNVSVNGQAVPEPAGWAMMLAGFGMIGGVLRGRRRVEVGLA